MAASSLFRIEGWLEEHGFYDATGTKAEDITFCRQRSDKAAICRDLQITHFVDDRLEILSSLESVEYRYLFQPRAEDLEEYG